MALHTSGEMVAFRKSRGTVAFRGAGGAGRAAGDALASARPGGPWPGPPFADPAWAGAQPSASGILSSILASATDFPIFATDQSGIVRLWSRGAAALYDQEATAVLGKLTWWDVCEPVGEAAAGAQAGAQAGGSLRPPLDTALRQGSWRGRVARPGQADGRPVAHVTVTPLHEDGGRHTGFLTVSRDISAEMRRLEELEDARGAARSLFQTNIVPLVTADPLGVITDVSPSVAPFTGRTREEMVGTSALEYAAEPERAQELIKEVLRDGHVSSREFTLRRADGSDVSVLLSASRLDGRDGKLQGLLATFVDLTAQRQLREDLRRSRAYYRSLLEAAADGLAAVDARGVITDVTHQLSALSGYERDELVGSAFADCFRDVEAAQRVVERGLSGQPAPETELRLVARDETVKRVSVSVGRVDRPGEPGVWLVASVRDVTEQAALRDRLTRERAYNRSIIESSANGLVICDLRHTITDVNPTMCQLAGRSQEELIGTALAECFADSGAATAAVNRALAAGGVTNAELSLANSDRSPALVNVSVLRDDADAPGGMLVSVRDVSEQARLQQDLAVQDAYARAVFQSSYAALFTISADGAIADVNVSAGRITGYSRQRLLGRPFGGLFTDPAAAAEGLAQAFREGHLDGYELTLAPVGRPSQPTCLTAGRFTDPRDGQSALIAALRDITEEKDVRERLHLYTQLLYRATTDALVITDPLGVITDVNHPMEVLTGRSRDELIGSGVEGCFTDPARAHEFVAAVLREGRVADFELTVQPPGSDATVLWYSAATFTDSVGRLEGIFASGRDITERKRFEDLQTGMLERARELDRAKSDFVSRVSHELRSPLTSVLGYLELLSGGEPGPLTPEQRQMMEVIYRNGRRLLSLIEDLLMLSKIESGVVTLMYEPVRLAALIDGVHESFLPAIRRGRLTSRVDAEEDLVLDGDPAQLERVVTNLLSNAVKFTPPGGQVGVRCWRRAGEALIEVSDTGIGVPEAEQKQLFTRFFRSSASAERETQGTGLGLHIVQQVVEAHRGTVTVKSAPGVGSTFTVALPIRRPPPGETRGTGPRSRQAGEG